MGYLSEGREMKLKRHLHNRSAMQNWVEAKICSRKGAETYARTEFSKKPKGELGKHCFNTTAYLQHITLKR